MKYVKQPIPQSGMDTMRINLSMREDALAPETENFGNARLSPDPTCDFCGDDQPVYQFAATQMSTGEVRQCWRWLACERCNRMIENGNWDALLRRMAVRFKSLFAGKLATLENRSQRAIPPGLIDRAVRESLEDFHNYAVTIMEAGTGKTSNQSE